MAISVSAPAQDSPAKERCAPGYGYDESRGECSACNQQCKTGKPGICGRGIVSCEGDSAICSPTVEPGERMEVCNGEDDDCNGRIDDGFDRDNDRYTTCSGDCNDRDPTVHPDAIERCDGRDNNCNGLIDDGFNVGGHCTAGFGACQASGRIACRPDGSGAACDAAPGEPGKEICDGIDNDCDGKVDEDLGELTCGVGACFRKVQACENGKELQCVPGEPAKELCGDGIDNNCDGRTDEGFAELGRTCYDGVGACRASGSMACSDDRLSLECSAVPGEPAAEICGNRIDDDCDGVTDSDAPGLGDPCANDQAGACARQGIMACDAAKGELVCNAKQAAPSKEICDGVDNDCDGEIDEGVRNACSGCGALPGEIGAACRVPGGDSCSTGIWACSKEEAGAAACSFFASMTDGASCPTDGNPCTVDVCKEGRCAHEPAPNGISCNDSDSCTVGDSCIDGQCAGGVMLGCDDANPCTEDTCDSALGCVHTPLGQGRQNACGGCVALPDIPGAACAIEGKSGPCSQGTYICQPDGSMLCVQSAFVRAEECNGVDDNCDGQVDEGLGTRECGIGACRREVELCQAGRIAECVPGDPAPESCSNMGVDDDCNGIVDDVAGVGAPCAVRIGTCVIPGKQSCVGDAQATICVPADASDAEDEDGDGTPNYCEREASAGGEAESAAEPARAPDLFFNPGRTRAAVLPWREAFDSLVLGAASPDSAMLLVSAASGEKAGFAVLRAKDASRQHFSFASCDASVGERPRLLAAAESVGSVVATSGGGYVRYHKISSQIPSPQAKDPACRLYGERLDLPSSRSFRTRRGDSSCEVASVESIAVMSEKPLVFAGAVKCRINLGTAQARVSDVLGIDIVTADDARGLSHEFIPVLSDTAKVDSARLLPVGRGRRAPLFIVVRADGGAKAGLCSHSKEQGWRCDLAPAPGIGSDVVFADRVDEGRGAAEILLVLKGGEALLAKIDGPVSKPTISSAGRAATATSGGAVEDAIIVNDPGSGERFVIVGRERSIAVASLVRAGDGSIRLAPAARGRFDPRSVQDDVSPGGKFSFNRPHAMAALPLKGYGGIDLFASFDMQKAGRPVGSMGFLYWNANEPPTGRLVDLSFDGARGRARLSFTDPTGDRLKYRARIKAGHGGSLDHWVDGVDGNWLNFSAKGDTSAVGLWPIEISVEASDTAGAIARSRAVMRRDGTVESITEASEIP